MGKGPVQALVKSWDAEEGWGVLVSDSFVGGCWAHFSAIEADGYRSLEPGERVLLAYETPGQDGQPHRAVTIWRDLSSA